MSPPRLAGPTKKILYSGDATIFAPARFKRDAQIIPPPSSAFNSPAIAAAIAGVFLGRLEHNYLELPPVSAFFYNGSREQGGLSPPQNASGTRKLNTVGDDNE
jgi:hypothetical protein